MSVYYNAGALNGFTNIGDINSHLASYEKQLEKNDRLEPLATSMLVMMVRGLFSRLRFPYVQFPCTDLSGTTVKCYILYMYTLCHNFISGDQLFDPLWEAVFRLECLGFRVMALCCDGLAANRRLFSLHQSKGIVHKVINPHAHSGERRPLFFLSDPPHLIKTVRNCWANYKRKLWVSIPLLKNFVLPFSAITSPYSAMGWTYPGVIWWNYTITTDPRHRTLDWLLFQSLNMSTST